MVKTYIFPFIIQHFSTLQNFLRSLRISQKNTRYAQTPKKFGKILPLKGVLKRVLAYRSTPGSGVIKRLYRPNNRRFRRTKHVAEDIETTTRKKLSILLTHQVLNSTKTLCHFQEIWAIPSKNSLK